MYTKYGFILISLLLLAFIYDRISELNFAIPDDNWMILGNEFIEMSDFFTIENIFKIFKTIDNGQYSPINTIYYRIIYDINGFDPYYYHLFSWLTHIGNVIMVFFLSKKLLILFNTHEKSLPFITCFIWGVHPLNVESVIWISASKILLFSLCSIGSTYFFIDALNTNKNTKLILSGILFLISCFIKEQAFMTSLVFILMMITYNDGNRRVFNRINFIIFLTIILSLSLFFGFLSIYANSTHLGDLFVKTYSTYERFVLSFYCLFFYLKALVIPTNLHYHYGFPFDQNTTLLAELLRYLVFFAGLLFLLVKLLKQIKHRYLYLFCIGAFLIHIILVLQIIPMTRPSAVADRYMYLPAIFLLTAIVHFCTRVFRLTSGIVKMIIQGSLIFYLSYLVIYSHHLVSNWISLNIIV